MKSFAKIIFLLICTSFVRSAWAQCTPDTTMQVGTIQPEVIKFAYANTVYQEVLYYKAPRDTTTKTAFGDLPVRIDSMEVTGVQGLPAGISYVCNTANCRFNGGNAGCLTVSGTPLTTGVYPLKVYITTYATITGTFEFPATQTDSNERYTLYVFGSVGMSDVSLDKLVEVYPNPAEKELTIQHVTGETIEATLTDVSGQKVLVQQVSTQAVIDVSYLAKGLYFLTLRDKERTHTRKVMLR